MFGKRPDLEVRSAGTSVDALTRVNARMLEWADLIFIMDDQQRRSLLRRFAGHPTLEHLVCLDIPDDFMQPELVNLLTAWAMPHLPLSVPAGARHAACQTTTDPPCRDS